MKTSTRLTAPGELPSDTVHGARATAPALPELSLLPPPESVHGDLDFRAMMHRRYTTPFPVVVPYHHGGLNE